MAMRSLGVSRAPTAATTPIFSLDNPVQLTAGGGNNKRFRPREAAVQQGKETTAEQVKKGSTTSSPKEWLEGSQDDDEQDEELLLVKKAAEGLVQKRRKVAIKTQVKAIDGLCSKYLGKMDDMEKTMNKIAGSNSTKVSRKFTGLGKKLQAKFKELEAAQSAYQQEIGRIWNEYLGLLGQKDSITKEAQKEAESQRDQCREALDRLMKEVNGELDETEARMLQMKEESKQLPHDITAMIAAVLRK